VHPPSSAPFEGLDAVFHLAGEPVAEGRWTTEKKRRILESRTVGTRAIVEAIGRTTRRPRVLVCASAVGFYGDRGDEALTEAAAPGEGFLSDVCVAWEQEALEAERRFGVRTVTLRIGIVLSPTGGALALSATAVYSIAFFVFWLLAALTCVLTLVLERGADECSTPRRRIVFDAAALDVFPELHDLRIAGASGRFAQSEVFFRLIKPFHIASLMP